MFFVVCQIRDVFAINAIVALGELGYGGFASILFYKRGLYPNVRNLK